MSAKETPRRAGRGAFTANSQAHPTTRPVESLAERFNKTRWTSAGGFVACCPAHDDHTPSLHIAEGEDGRALIYCFAGCTAGEIVDALGLEMRDLFSKEGHRNYSPRQGLSAREKRAIKDALAHERTVLEILAADAEASRLTPADADRWAVCMDRIAKAKKALRHG